jgi:hypothetical protein
MDQLVDLLVGQPVVGEPLHGGARGGRRRVDEFDCGWRLLDRVGRVDAVPDKEVDRMPVAVVASVLAVLPDQRMGGVQVVDHVRGEGVLVIGAHRPGAVVAQGQVQHRFQAAPLGPLRRGDHRLLVNHPGVAGQHRAGSGDVLSGLARASVRRASPGLSG